MRSGAGQGLVGQAWVRAPKGCAALLLLSTAVTTGVVGVASAQAPGSDARVVAPAASHDFAIPPQPLAGAISAFSRVTGLDVVGDGGIARGVRSPGVSGHLTPRQALARLLEGTGLGYRFTNASTVAIQRPNADGSVGAAPAGAISLDTIDVQGETAWGPVNGFVASRSATGTKTDTPIIEVPQSISVITRDQIEARKPSVLVDALTYTPGVTAEVSGIMPSDSIIKIRGFDAWDRNSGKGAFYLNGLRTPNGAYEPYGLERIEVMRGAASVLYGQGQPSGIVNLATKRPTEQPVREIMLQGGSFDRKVGAFDFGGPANDDKTLLYRFTGLIRDANSQIDFSPDDRVFFSGAVTWRPTDATDIMFYGNYQKDRYRYNGNLPAQGTILPNPNGRIPLSRFLGEPTPDLINTNELASVGYSAEHRTDVGWTFRQNLRYDYGDNSRNTVSARGLQADLRTANRIQFNSPRLENQFELDNQAELKATTGPLKQTLLVGVNYRRTSYREKDYFGSVPPIDVYAPVYGQPLPPTVFDWDQTIALQQAGLYLQDQIKLDHWILTLGGRHDWATSKAHNNLLNVPAQQQDDRAFTKRAGLGYEFDFGLVPYVGYAQSFEPVSGTTFEGTLFKPETGRLYEAGIKYQPQGTNVRFTAAIFDLRRQNVLAPDPDPAHPFESIQIGEVTSRGLELEAVASLTNNIDLTAAYTYNDVKITKSSSIDETLGKRLPRAPQNMASLWADYTIREGALSGFGFGAGVRYVGESAGDDLNTFYVPAYTLVDAMIRYDINNWRFSVNATNLFDQYYIPACSSIATCAVGRTRTVLGTVTYRW
ncbi:TonB-dependent siderophore receptor [Nitrobacter sp.]|uniref:TonB-dependent siderophore receptor n=1 Tax=Nitrobacter sp. TaxID=29420 RepID=UPI003F64EF0D